MLYVFIFVIGGIVFILAGWFWEVITAQTHGPVVRAIDEDRAAAENEKLLEEFAEDGLDGLSRSEIWTRMSWVWKETRGWAFRSRNFLTLSCLLLFALLYIALWFKTLILPNGDNLGLMLGGRSLHLYVAQERS